MVSKIDGVDERILSVLSKNSKLSYRKIASKVGVSGVTVLKRVKNLEKAGIIRGYNVDLDYDKMGYDVSAVVRARVVCGRYSEIKKIAGLSGVVTIYDVTGDFDVLIIVRFKNRRLMNNFLKKVQKFDFIERTETSLILNIIKG